MLIYTFGAILIFPLLRFIFCFSPFSQETIIYSIDCLQALIVSIFSAIYSWNNNLFISYYIDASYIRYRKDSIIEYMIDLILGYLLIDIYRSKITFIMISHHLLGILAFLMIRVTGYGYLLALYFMLTEITTPFMLLRKYMYKNKLNTRFSDCLIVTIYFLIRIMPLPYILFLLCQIFVHRDENILMANVSLVSIPAISSINAVWFYNIIKKSAIIPRVMKISLIMSYMIYIFWLTWSIYSKKIDV